MTKTPDRHPAPKPFWSKALTSLLCVSALAGLRCDRSNAPEALRVEINGCLWRVETAQTGMARHRGLSFRRSLRPDAGMLFIYPKPDVLEFCMRDCEIPLDIAFIDADLKVVRIHTMPVEPDRAGTVRYTSGAPAQYALEVRAGEFESAGIKVGQKVTFHGPLPNPALAEPDE